MAKGVFFSYAREDRGVVAPFARYIENAGFAVFFDQEIIGGQQWWDRLLTKIEECDAFVPVLSSLYLRSGPCRIEVSYAVELGKTLIPMDLSAGTLASAAFIEPIKASQWVTYDADDQMGTVLKLVAAINNSPDAPPLPEARQRPQAPGADVLASAVRLVGSTATLTETEQWAVVGELRANMRGETGPAARALLESFLLRRDLLASVYEDASTMVVESQTPPRTAPAEKAAAPRPATVAEPRPAPEHHTEPPATTAPGKPPTYLAMSVVAAVVAFYPYFVGTVLGLAAVLYSLRARRLLRLGDEPGARKASRRAALWILVTAACFVVSVLAYHGALE
jgi:hypothetical protein